LYSGNFSLMSWFLWFVFQSRLMKIREVAELLSARVVCGDDKLDHLIAYGFASDLMSDVLTLECENVLLVTGLCNLQTIRTAEMADITCIVFVRNKIVSEDMLSVAQENNMILLETSYSMYRTVGLLHTINLPPVF